MRRILRPKTLPPSDREMGYSYGVQVGNMIWVSGQVARNERNELVGGDDPVAQTEQCFRSVAAVFAEAGRRCAMSSSSTSSLRTRASPRQRVRKRVFADPDYPTAAMLVAATIRPEYLVEIQAAAIVSRSTSPG